MVPQFLPQEIPRLHRVHIETVITSFACDEVFLWWISLI
jgi:hypothetical protein